MSVVLAWAWSHYVGRYGEFVIAESIDIPFDEATAIPFVL